MGNVLRLFDGLRNAITGAGTTRDPRTQSAYAAPIPLNQQSIDAAYRGSGLMRKIIQIPAMDMVREWRDWKAESEQITALEAEEQRLGLRQKIRQAEVLRGLGGGALILGLPGEPEQPAPSTVGKAGLAFVNVVSRWHLTFDELEDDARLPGYGEPKMWKLNTGSGQREIHPSRVVAFRADTSASLAAVNAGNWHDMFWGESTVAQVLDAVEDCDKARGSFAALMHKARITRVGIPNLSDIVSTTDGESAIASRLATLALAESMFNVAIHDSGNGGTNPGETIGDVQYNFAGAKDILNAYAEFVAAISDIPATRLLGRAPEGMNASGDSQQKDWNKKVMARQTLDLAPCLDRIDRYLIPSALGSRPAEVWFEFAPLDTPTEKEKADTFFALTQGIEKLQSTATIPDIAFAKGVQSLMIDLGILPELEQALSELPEDERYGIEPNVGIGLDDPEAAKGGDPSEIGAGGAEPVSEPPRRAANDAAPRTLYVQRKLLNAAEFLAWAKAQGFETTVPADDLHVTVTFSRTPVDWMKMGSPWNEDGKGEFTVPAGGARLVEPLGDKGAVVLLFNSSALSWRHEEMVRNGASHDFPEYQPHVTISYAGTGIDLAKVEPYRGELRFGPEIFEELNEDWTSAVKET